jgi:glutathione peroxidase-family protein
MFDLQFGGQEPGSNAEVKKFAQARGAKFPIMAKIDVNGSNGALPASRMRAILALRMDGRY